jgi:hypothetical protein
MRIQQKPPGLPSMWGLLLVAGLAACGSDSTNGQTVTVNLSLIVNARQAHDQSIPSRMFAWIARWFPGATPAWAQSVSDIASIQVQISGPGIPSPATTTVPVSDPTSGQEIPVSVQAPVGPNRTITVTAFNAASPPQKNFEGTLPGVNLTAGAPIDLEITLVSLFTVTVQKVGDGNGTVTSSPAGIDCGATCVNQFQEGTTVALNAAADSGSTFAGWSGGGCSGTGPCSVTNSATVTASFNIAISTDRLTVNLAGSGTGTVTSNPGGISCPGTCAADFATGTTVTLNPTPTNGSMFNGFSGAGCSGPGSSCIVAMVGNPTVTATFTAGSVLFTLTVTKAGAGAGTVSSDPPGITACSTMCSANFAPGTVVTLTATPQSGSTFAGWGGACSGAGSCSVDMNGNRSVTATFNPPVSVSNLIVQKIGTGSGTVTSQPGGINCGPTCGAAFPTGTVVTLTATPAAGSTLTGWSGNIPCGGSGPCVITLNSDVTAMPQFDLAAPDFVILTVGKQGRGAGTVSSNPGGIFCGDACQFSFQRGTSVTLTATPDVGSSFNDWHGGPCDNSSSLICQLVMNDNETVSAHFDGGGPGGGGPGGDDD